MRRLVGLHGVGGVGLVGQDLGLPELGGQHLGADLVPVFARNVPAHRVVAREGAVAEGAGHPDALVPLADVRPQVRLVAVGPLAEGTLQFRSLNKKNMEISLKRNYKVDSFGCVKEMSVTSKTKTQIVQQERERLDFLPSISVLISMEEVYFQ